MPRAFTVAQITAAVFIALPAFGQLGTRLSPETLAEFQKYQANVDREIEQQISGARPFQWIEKHPEKARAAQQGQVVTYAFTGSNGVSVTGGLIHDWVGVIYLRRVKLNELRDFILNTDRQPAAYAELRSAKTLSRDANQSVTQMRVVKKKIITAVLDIEYENAWRSPAPDKWAFSSRSRKVLEVDDAGTPKEKVLPPDTGRGFLWRMNSQWLLREDAEGVWAELRVVSLSRDTPRGLGWAIKPLIRDFPAEGITTTLRQTQAALQRKERADSTVCLPSRRPA